MNNPTRRHFIKRQCHAHCGLGVLKAADTNVDLTRLRAGLKGQLIVPGEEAYESAKRVSYWNPRTERHPIAVVRCGAEDDAVRAVAFAREHGLEIAVRSGGHSHLAWGSSDGIVIDFASQRDHDRSRTPYCRAQAGFSEGTRPRAAGTRSRPRPRAMPRSGPRPAVILGGGLGWLSGLFGACCATSSPPGSSMPRPIPSR